MAKNRYLNTKFWDDSYISNLDPIEKLLFIYFLTNPLTNICGIYEIEIRRISFDTGIEKEMVFKILNRFERDGKMKYSGGWIAIKNWIKHQAVDDKSNVKVGIERGLLLAPKELKEYLEAPLSPLNPLQLLEPKLEPKLEPEYEPLIADIISYLNLITKKHFKDNTENTKKHIRARIKEGYKLVDFKKVIDIKSKEWLLDKKMNGYLRPDTLFGPKFESYLNINAPTPKTSKALN